MQELFMWRGEPIKDIRKFCKERKCDMVRYKAKKRTPNIFNGKIDIEEKISEMPSLFFDSMRMTADCYYIEINRYKIT